MSSCDIHSNPHAVGRTVSQGAAFYHCLADRFDLRYAIQSNRVIRRYKDDEDHFIRVDFRDEDRLAYRWDREVDGMRIQQSTSPCPNHHRPQEHHSSETALGSFSKTALN
jgi:hypothetical protein